MSIIATCGHKLTKDEQMGIFVECHDTDKVGLYGSNIVGIGVK